MGGVRLEARGSGPTPVNDTRAGNGAAEGGQQAGRAQGRQRPSSAKTRTSPLSFQECSSGQASS